ncbi:MAG: ketopantoate reductase family protein [Dehalococcoidia bacterium]|nr:MAG: ketopantoate reductase family protein [Dehalococcoidia bacterium]
MKKIAIAGVGGIGGNMGGYMTRGGQDVTLICMSWKENAEVIKKDGLTLISPSGEQQTVRPKVLFVDELPQVKEKFQVLFICMSSNDTVKTLNIIKPYITEDCWVISPQNGINEDLIIPIAGRKNVIPCVSHTGGGFVRPGVVSMHEGYYVIGELDGKITPRIKELAEMLRLVVPVRISDNVMQARWHKLCIAAMVAPVAQIYGFEHGFLRGAFSHEKTRQVLARFVIEVNRVAGAAGYPLDNVETIKIADWAKYAKFPTIELGQQIETAGAHFPGNTPPGIGKKGNADQRKISFSSEMDHINGYITRKGKELGIPTPVNDLVVEMVFAMETGKIKPGLANLEKIIKLTDPK